MMETTVKPTASGQLERSSEEISAVEVKGANQLIELAINQNVPVETLERLFAMDERIRARNAEVAFNEALTAVQEHMPRIQKDAENKQTSSMYARLETVNQALIPVYTQHGFSLSFGTEESKKEDHERVICYVSHKSGHTRTYHYDSPLDMTGIAGKVNKTRTHGSGSALSYGRRYLTLMIFNATMAGEDDDGQAAGGEVPAEEQQAPRMAPVKKRQYIEAVLEAVKAEDGPGLLQIWEEMGSETILAIWSDLRSYERTAIKKLLEQARSAIDPNYIEPLAQPHTAKDQHREETRAKK
jgi:hypothetical protein